MPEVEPRVEIQGFQFLKSFDCTYGILGVTNVSGVGATIFHRGGEKKVLKVIPYSKYQQPTNYTLPYDVTHLLYVSQLRLYVAACKDLCLRIFSNCFNLISRVAVSSTVISLAFNPNEHELYTGGSGRIIAWKLRYNLFKPLVRGKPFRRFLKKSEWACILNFYSSSSKLLVCSTWSVYVLDTLSREVVSVYSTLHIAITSTALADKQGCLLIGTKPGPIKVWSYELDIIAHSFIGHSKAVTCLVVHPVSPSIISCSLDKTIRIWNLENRIQTHIVRCEKEVLGMCWDYPRLTCYSERSLSMWSISRLESHFASINSSAIKIQRVDISCQQVARILTLAEDGSVRLLSPISGQVITILFPMFSTRPIEDVLYSQTDELVFLLLNTNNVLVFDARYNPCLTKELWTPTVQYHKIGCFTMCHILSTGKVHALVFGGQLDGNIVLIYSSEGILDMPYPCSSHRGHITNIVGSCDLVTERSTPALVTYGKLEKILNIWVVNIIESSCSVSLSCHHSIDMMDDIPQRILLTNTTICLALEDKQLIMLKMPDQLQSRYSNTSSELSKLSVMRHQNGDDHKDCINSLVTCSYLQIVVTSSNDGIIKVWNLKNQLVSDLDMAVTVSSVGICSANGDLLIGARNMISFLGVEEYLPCEFVNIAKTCPKWDAVEKPIRFDPELEFWYDSSRVPSLPLNQLRRKYYIVKYPKFDFSQFRLLNKNASVCSVIPSYNKIEGAYEINVNDSFILEQQVDKKLAKFHGQHFTSFSSDTKDDVSTDEFTHSLSLGHSVSDKVYEMVKMSPHQFFMMEYPRGQPQAIVNPLQYPSSRIIAPDGYIPNSIIREIINLASPYPLFVKESIIREIISPGSLVKGEVGYPSRVTGILTALEMENLKNEITSLAEKLQSFYESMAVAAKGSVMPTVHKSLKKRKRRIDKTLWLSKKELKTTVSELLELSELLPGEYSQPTSSMQSMILSQSEIPKGVSKSKLLPKRIKTFTNGVSEADSSIVSGSLAISGPLYPKMSIQKGESIQARVTQTAMTSKVLSQNFKEATQTMVITPTAVASKDLSQDTRRDTRAAEWKGSGILYDAISRRWFPKEFVPEGEPTVCGVYKGLMEAVRKTEPVGNEYSEILDFLLTLKVEGMLDDAEVRDISSQLTSQLQSRFVRKGQEEILPASVDISTHDTTATRDTTATESASTRNGGFGGIFKGPLVYSRFSSGLGHSRSVSKVHDGRDNESSRLSISRSSALGVSRSDGLSSSRSGLLSASRSSRLSGISGLLSASRSSRLNGIRSGLLSAGRSSGIRSDGYSDGMSDGKSDRYGDSGSDGIGISGISGDKSDDKGDRYSDSRRGGFGKIGYITSDEGLAISKSDAYSYTRDGDGYTHGDGLLDASRFSIPSDTIYHALREIGKFDRARAVSFVEELDERLKAAHVVTPVATSGRIAKTGGKGGGKYHRKKLDMKSRAEIGKSRAKAWKLKAKIWKSKIEVGKSRAKLATKIGKPRAEVLQSRPEVEKSRTEIVKETVSSYLTSDESSREDYNANTTRLLKALEILDLRGETHVIQTIYPFLMDKYEEVRLSAARTLLLLADANSIENLEAFLKRHNVVPKAVNIAEILADILKLKEVTLLERQSHDIKMDVSMKPTKALPKRLHHPIITKRLKTQIHRRDIYSTAVTEQHSDAKSPTTPTYLPFTAGKQSDIPRSRKVFERQKRNLIWEGETGISVIIIPGSKKDMIRADGRGIYRHDSSEGQGQDSGAERQGIYRQDSGAMLTNAQVCDWKRGSRKSQFSESFPQEGVLRKKKLALPCDNYTNYMWLDTKYYPRLAKGVNVTGMDIIQTFSGYPNIIAHSKLINKWMLGMYK